MGYRWSLKASAIGVAAVLSSGIAHANLVGNGSFEAFTGLFGGDGGAQLTSTSTTLMGWTVVGGEIAVLKTPNVYQLTAADGVNFLDLTGYTNASFPKGVTQTISGLSIGQSYTLTFETGIDNGSTVGPYGGPISGTASFGGQSNLLTDSDSGSGIQWHTFSFNFTATAVSEALTIVANNVPPGGQYFGVDNVDLEAGGGGGTVPEPATLSLFGMGLAGMGLLRCLRRR
jgi:hypothetical protein